MTVAAFSSGRVQISGDGVTDSVAIPFVFVDEDNLKVVHTDSSGIDTTWVYGASPGSWAYTGGNFNTGSVTFTAADLATGETLTVTLIDPVDQPYDLDNSEIDPVQLQSTVDHLAITSQALAQKMTRAVLLKETTALSSGITFPEASAGKLIGWNAGGTDLENKTVTDGTETLPATASNWIKRNSAGTAFEAKTDTEALSEIGVYATRAQAAALSFASGMKALRTVGYATAGDGGHALYIRVDSEPSTDGGKFRSVDRYLSDGTTDATNGGWWKLAENSLNPYQFGALGGASFGSGDDTDAFLNMLAFSDANGGLPMFIFPDTYRIVGEELLLDFRTQFMGFNRHTTKIIFAGTPTRTKRTRDVWMTEYDTGDYSQESDDPAIACGILLMASKTEVRGVYAQLEYTVVADYDTPFDAATDYPGNSPTSTYDNAFFVGAPDCIIDNVETAGPWGSFGGNGGIRLDPTVFDTLEHVKVSNSVFRGRYGVAITGPKGQPDSGVTYMEMTSSDTRGGGGISDTVFINCECYDTQIRLSIDGNSNRLVKRYAGTGGALFVEGQIALNTAKRQQQVKFFNCRFANVDEYTIFVNYINRLGFIDCHFEWRSGSYIEDGETAQTSSDNAGRYITANARHVLFLGGEFSGETDNMTYRDDETQIVTLSNVSVATDDGLTKGRVNTGTRAFVKPSWTPTLTASSGTASFSVAEAYGYVTDGVMKFNIKFVLSATSLSGPLLVSLHDDYPKANVDGDDKQLVQLAVDNATAGACGCFGVINNGGTSVVLYHQDSSGWSNMQGSDLTSSSELMISGEYAFA